MTQEQQIKGRIIDLASRAYRDNVYCFTDFLGLAEQSIYHKIKNELPPIKSSLYGGFDDAERVMIGFGSKEDMGYSQPFPISVVQVLPKMEKYSEALTHRDCLGALMNLGIERSVLGDIIFREKEIYIFCKENIAKFLEENLYKIRHTNVKSSLYDGDISQATPRLEPMDIQVSSIRADAIISKVFKLSREKSLDLFKSGRIFLNGKQMTSNSAKPKEADIISAKGYGRIRYIGEEKTTRKGNLVVRIEKYI